MRIITPINVTGPTTFTRAGTATYTTKAGLLATAAVDELRPYYLATETHLMGVMIEAAGTNLVLQSSDWTNASWAKTSVTATGNTTTDPIGTTTADTLSATVADGVASQAITFTTNADKAVSVWLKAGTAAATHIILQDTTASAVRLRANVAWAAGVPTVTMVTGTMVLLETFASGLYRLQMTATGVIASNTNSLRIYPAGLGTAATGTVIAWGAQAENVSKPTSYIATTTATASRVADTMTGTGLAFSNVPETDYAQWSAGTYTLGTRRLYLRQVYEVIVASTTDNPATGAALTVPSWLLVGSENRYKMFDQTISTQTSQATSIEAAVTPGGIVNAVAFFGLSGNKVTVTVDDLTEGVVYDTTKSLQDYTSITDWYAYFFDDIVQRTDIVFLDLPSYGSATLGFTIEGVAAECGEVVFGRQKILGVSNYGTSISIQDYSIKSRDAFGNTIITQRAFSKRADYDVTVETAAVSAVQQALAAIRTTPTVFVGEETKAETIVYGFYRAFNIVLANPSVSDCTVEVEGLV
ncbi:hypothetical protein UFOVP166_53 [uncultured Caudovirales phage]|uniref:Tail protein n=1 Tax=uncultured Caudovirales phage TaxID=2100421 RepID=A0A6J7WA93_9CAUD|nr:hypothetical protein UFOVP166_53 [uncultured Caudovirales phage]